MTRSKSKAYWIQCLLSFVPANAKAIWLKELLTKVFAPPKVFTITDLKQRTLAFNHLHHLPSPEQFQLTPACLFHSKRVLRHIWGIQIIKKNVR